VGIYRHFSYMLPWLDREIDSIHVSKYLVLEDFVIFETLQSVPCNVVYTDVSDKGSAFILKAWYMLDD
jgi:hypothetical protein